jgi:hypothetical protein
MGIKNSTWQHVNNRILYAGCEYHGVRNSFGITAGKDLNDKDSMFGYFSVSYR